MRRFSEQDYLLGPLLCSQRSKQNLAKLCPRSGEFFLTLLVIANDHWPGDIVVDPFGASVALIQTGELGFSIIVGEKTR